jgi:hypothetical protein
MFAMPRGTAIPVAAEHKLKRKLVLRTVEVRK